MCLGKREISSSLTRFIMPKKKAVLPTNCAFCNQRIDCSSQRQHSQRHEFELTEIYREIGEEHGINVQFGTDCHSICCHQHTIHLRPLSTSNIINVSEFISSLRRAIHAIFNHPLICQTRIRAQFLIYATFESRREFQRTRKESTYHGSFMSHMMTIALNLDEQIDQAIAHIEPKLEKFTRDKSGWTLKSIDALSIKMTCGVNHSGGAPITIPPRLKKCHYVKVLRGGKKSNHCFETAVRYCLAQEAGMDMRQIKDVEKVESLRENIPLNCKDMPFPFEFKYFQTFEKRNNIALRVYLHDGSKIRGTLYAKHEEANDKKVYLIYLANQTREEEYPGHFLPITNMRSLVNDIDKSSRRNLNFYCDYCLKGFRGQNEFSLHMDFCSKLEKPQRTVLPKNLSHHEFKDHTKTTQPINVVYADIEAMIQTDGEAKKHDPIAVGCQTVWHKSLKKDSHEQFTFVGASCILEFLDYLEYLVHYNFKHLANTYQQIEMNETDIRNHAEAKQCAFCTTEFNFEDKNRKKCADHDHITGDYLQALCGRCNRLRRQSRYRLPVLFHNLKGYDAHHLMRFGLIKRKEWKIHPLYQSGSNCIAINVDVPISDELLNEDEGTGEEMEEENETGLKSRKTYRISFIDSLQFLKGSLDNQSKTLEATPFTENMLKRYYNLEVDTVKFTKGVFPYSFLSSIEKLDAESLPSIDHFFNDLTDEPCSKENYEHAKQAWNDAGCFTFKDYLIYYLKLDVALLADCFEKFRHTAVKEAGLDPVHFYGIPGFTFSFAYKFTSMKLQALPSTELYLLFESACRGGMVFINKHHVESDFDETKHLYHHIFYIDANGLYGSSMSSKLPKDGFRELSSEEMQLFTSEWFINDFDTQGEKGYLVCCDLEYPPEVQNETMDFPLAPETCTISWDELSPFSQDEWKRQRGSEPFIPCKKLMMTHRDKYNYTVHSSLLKYYLMRGLRMKKVHKIIEFNQEAYLKPYIDYHTKARSRSSTEEAKQFHKLNVNSLFGKTMENPRRYKKSYLVRDPHYLFRHASSPLCDSVIPLDEYTCIVNLRQAEVELSKPIFIGQAVLDLSKLIMYEMFDRWKANELMKNVELVGGDTDSFFLYVSSKYSRDEILYSFKDEFDSSNYPLNHPLYSPANKSKLGYFKDETRGQAIKSLYMQSPKTYSIITENDCRVARAKGIQSHKRDKFSHKEFRDIQEDGKIRSVSQTSIQSKYHEVFTITQEKRALACWDTKRFWLNDNLSVPYGHYKIPHLINQSKRIHSIPTPPSPPKRGKIEKKQIWRNI